MNPSFLSPYLPLLLFASLPSAPLPAQEVTGDWSVLQRWEGEIEQQYLGVALASPGDLDGDGVPDFVFGSRQHKVWVVSGATGQEIEEIESPAPPDLFGSVVEVVHDLDQDGVVDLLIGAPRMDPFGRRDAGIVVVMSGASGEEIRRIHGRGWRGNFGHALAGLGDIDGDGMGDFAVGAPGEDPLGKGYQCGSVRVYSSGLGQMLWMTTGDGFSEHYGSALASVPDLNGDGIQELVVGAPDASPFGRLFAGYVEVLSGADGSTLHVFEGREWFASFGDAVAHAGDTNGDQVPDLLIGAPRSSINGFHSGQALLYSGADGSELDSFKGPSPYSWFGGAVAGIQDIDGDGHDDLIVGGELSPWVSSGTPTGLAKVYSGVDGQMLFRHDGFKGRDHFGRSVAGVGDLDADGVPDYAIGSMESDVLGSALYDAGSVYVHSGADGSLIQQIDGTSPSQRLGSSLVATGDLDHDGVSDLLVGAYSSAATLFSGAGGTVVATVTDGSDGDSFGRSAAALGDLDGDGVGDFAVGAYDADPNGLRSAGAVYVYSGATRQLLFQVDGIDAYGYFGTTVAAVGDLDRDGVPDLVAGAPYADVDGKIDCGYAAAYSGVDGSEIQFHAGEAAGDRLGISVSGAGDFNRDGRLDWVAGAYWADPGGENSGAALVFSGKNHRVLARLNGERAWDYHGWSVSRAGDVNGDGYGDVIVGAKYADPGGNSEAGAVYVYGGPHGAKLAEIHGQDEEDTFGNTVLGGMDLDGDGTPDFAVGSKYHDVDGMSNAGSVFLYSGATFDLLDRLDGRAPNDELGKALASVEDLDGDGLDEILACAFEAKPNGPSSGEVILAGVEAPLWLAGGLLSADADNELLIRRATPEVELKLAWSQHGAGPTVTGWATVLLTPPWNWLPPVNSTSGGDARFSFWVPASLSGETLWFQAFEPGSGDASNGISRTLQ